MEYTVKQLADILEVSKPTVQKAIKKLEIAPTRRENNGRAYYEYSDAVAILKEVNPSFDYANFAPTTEKPQSEPQNTENLRKTPQNEPQNTEKPTTQEKEPLLQALEMLQAELNEKNKQLEVKDKQIQDLNDRLAEAMALTKGQQYIAAADKTTELLEADSKRGQQNETTPKEKETVIFTDWKDEENAAAAPAAQEKKSFWQKIFGK